MNLADFNDFEEWAVYFVFRLEGTDLEPLKSSVATKAATFHPRWVPPENFQLHSEKLGGILVVNAYHCHPVFQKDELLATCRIGIPVEFPRTSHWYAMSRRSTNAGTARNSASEWNSSKVLLDTEWRSY